MRFTLLDNILTIQTSREEILLQIHIIDHKKLINGFSNLSKMMRLGLFYNNGKHNECLFQISDKIHMKYDVVISDGSGYLEVESHECERPLYMLIYVPFRLNNIEYANFFSILSFTLEEHDFDPTFDSYHETGIMDITLEEFYIMGVGRYLQEFKSDED